ncbi:MAG: hypothetical protein HOV67_17555 [Kribbellaceae bacterium]|nr:hypothetical protein [Kribbellaceae bacterium]
MRGPATSTSLAPAAVIRHTTVVAGSGGRTVTGAGAGVRLTVSIHGCTVRA